WRNVSMLMCQSLFFFSSRRRHTRFSRDWSSDVCSSDLYNCVHIQCLNMHIMDWDGIRYFLEVARTQRVSGAAKRLGVQHTTVSRRIHLLEQSLNTVLFNKSKA